MNTLRKKTNSTLLVTALLAGALLMTTDATQAQIKGSALPVADTLTLADRVMMVTDPSGTPTTKTATLTLLKATMAAGSGDVVGPASAVNNRVAFFDGTTGKLIKDSGLTLSGTNTGDQDLSSYLTSSTAAATYQALDSDLTAIALLTTTSTGRSLLAASDAASIRTIAGITFGGTRQILHSDLSGLPTSSTLSSILDFTGNTRGSVLYRGGLTWTVLTPGASGQVLTSGGAGADPSWTTVGVSDGDKGSITVSSSGTVWTIDASAVTDSMLAGSISPSKISGTAAILGANTFTAAQMVDGSEDAIQTLIQGHSTQTAAIFTVEKSTGVDVLSATQTGGVILGGGASVPLSIVSSTATVTFTATGDGSLLQSHSIVLPANGYIRYGFTGGTDPILTASASKLTLSQALLSTRLYLETAAAPSSASDTGTVNEVRWDANFIYICTATNTWKRVAIATW